MRSVEERLKGGPEPKRGVRRTAPNNAEASRAQRNGLMAVRKRNAIHVLKAFPFDGRILALPHDGNDRK
jgi:hypothetical protein